MTNFTIEQLEELGEGAPVMHRSSKGAGATRTHAVKADNGMLRALVGYGPDGGTAYKDAERFAAAPALIDALIAEKRKHDDLRQEIGSLIGRLETRAENAHSNRSYASAVAFRETARDLTRILKATDG